MGTVQARLAERRVQAAGSSAALGSRGWWQEAGREARLHRKPLAKKKPPLIEETINWGVCINGMNNEDVFVTNFVVKKPFARSENGESPS